MKHFVKNTMLATSLALLGACSSSSTSDDSGPAPVTYAALEQELLDLQALHAGSARAGEADILGAANATYTGVVAVDVAGNGLAGELTIAADFGADTADVSATNFVHETDGVYAGTLTDTGGVISPTATGLLPQVQASMTGDLTNGGNTFSSLIALDGEFVEVGTDPVGAIVGTALGNVGADSITTGDFVADK